MHTLEILREWRESRAGVDYVSLAVRFVGVRPPPEQGKRRKKHYELNIHVPLGALGDRAASYQLDTEQDVIDAILKEHATRILQLEHDLHPHPLIAEWGGLRNDVKIVRNNDGKAGTW